MFDRAWMLYLYVETPLHAGTGRGIGAIDLPIQRERTTDYPTIYASSLKGRLRAEVAQKLPLGEKSPTLLSIFGQAEEAGAFGGALSPGDARLLLFPVRSLAGVWAWTTCPAVLQRFVRDAAGLGLELPDWWPQVAALLPTEPAQGNEKTATEIALVAPTGKDSEKAAIEVALVAPTGVSTLPVGSSGAIVLEEISYPVRAQALVQELGEWLATNALPPDAAYNPWRTRLPQQLVILSDDAFRDFVQFSTEVVTRVRLDYQTKTVVPGALWTEEHLPPESLLYAPIYVGATRQSKNGDVINGAKEAITAQAVADQLHGLVPARIRLGGDETVGRGLVHVRWAGPYQLRSAGEETTNGTQG